jgi:hypothetical protein
MFSGPVRLEVDINERDSNKTREVSMAGWLGYQIVVIA